MQYSVGEAVLVEFKWNQRLAQIIEKGSFGSEVIKVSFLPSSGSTSKESSWVFEESVKKLEIQETNPTNCCHKKQKPEIAGWNFLYLESSDGVDENILIMLHGLGDSPNPYMQLAKNMQIPQTACLCLEAPEKLPFDLGHAWFKGFDHTFEPLGFGYQPSVTGKEELDQQMRSLVATRRRLTALSAALADNWGWAPGRQLLLGFSQGGTAALDLALAGGREFAGVISVAGPLLHHAIKENRYAAAAAAAVGGEEAFGGGGPAASPPPLPPVLLVAGAHDQVVKLEDMEQTKSHIEHTCGHQNANCSRSVVGDMLQEDAKENGPLVQLHICPNKGHQMIASKDEMSAVMRFIGQRTVRRLLNLEASSDLVELTAAENISK